MGIFTKLFARQVHAPHVMKQDGTQFAFVLLSEPRSPDADAIVGAFREFAAENEDLQHDAGTDDKKSGDGVITFTLSTGERSFVGLMPMPVPNGEADEAARFSLSSFRNHWKLPQHTAHYMVSFHAAPESQPVVRLSRFTSVLAAVTKASPAVGIYWGNAGATHDSNFFTEIAKDQGVVPRMMLWSGVSIAREKDGRLSVLSLGMKQLGLPDLWLRAGKQSEADAVQTLFDLLAYVASRGTPLPNGDTVGRSATEKLVIKYVPSPADSTSTVWRVDLP